MDDATKQQAAKILSAMTEPVTVHYFTADEGEHCDFCTEINELVELVQSLAPEGKMKVEKHIFSKESELATSLKVDKFPAIALRGSKNAHIQFYGIPSGYEFGSFLEGLVEASHGETSLISDEGKEFFRSIDKPVRLQVFVTPTCPYCPRSVRLAHAAALLNENIIADMIEAMEFQELSAKHSVMGVPKTVVNDKESFAGAAPESTLIETIQKVLK